MNRSVAPANLSRTDVVEVLRERFPELAERFHVSRIALFGSFARDEQTPESDVDLVVTFSRPVGFAFVHLAERLETLLGRPVDLLAEDGIKPNRRDSVLQSLIHVAP